MNEAGVACIVFLTTALVVSTISGVLFYNFPYQTDVEKSERAVKTLCTITNNRLNTKECGTRKHLYTCFSAIVMLNYVANTTEYKGVELNVCDNSATDSDVNRCIALHYLPGSNVTCYYDPVLPRDVRFSIENKTTLFGYAFLAVFLGLFCGVCAVGAWMTTLWRNKFKI